MPANASQFDWVLLPFAGVLGAAVGSFLNAAIYRLPGNISLIKEKRCMVLQGHIKLQTPMFQNHLIVD